MSEALKFHAKIIIEILLQFTISSNSKYQETAYSALKDYLLLNHKNLVDDISTIIQAMIVGTLIPNSKINEECATAISFLITQRIVYDSEITASTSK